MANIRPAQLSVENLESRFNLSAAPAAAGGLAAFLQSLPASVQQGLAHRYQSLPSWVDQSVQSSSSPSAVLEVGRRARTPTTTTVPAAPTGLGISSDLSNAIALQWTDNATNESGYYVYRSTDGSNFSRVGTVGAGVTTYTDSTVTPATQYWFKVSAYNSAGQAYSSTVTAATPAAVVTAPAAPTGLAVSSDNYNGVSLKWTNSAGNASGNYVYRSTDGTNYSQVATLSATSTSYTDSTVAAATQYYYEVSAYNSAGEATSAPVAAATPDAPAPSTLPVTITQRSMKSFTELLIDGTSGNDSIAISESGSTITVVANGQTQTVSGTFGDIMIKGEAGDNTITVDSSVNIATLLYGGTGNATLVDHGTNFNTLVTTGGGTSSLTGNGVNTNYWANTGDTINASSAEVAAGEVHRVGSFVNPAEPTDTTGAYKLANSSLFGTGPTFYDVNQRQIADCYYLSTIQSLSFSNPTKLRTLAVDLGDGTYGVQFDRSGTFTYVRVDGTFSSQASVVGASGNDWALVMEKAYAYFRSGANTYSSLNYGNSGTVMGDFGISHSSLSATSSASTIYNTIQNELAANKPVTASTVSSATALVSSHCYSVVGVSTDSSGTMWITLRNPWGFDGTGSDSNTSDGLVTISMATFQTNVSWMDYAA
jgi:hypothetical protein